MAIYEVTAERPGYYNDGDGRVNVRCVDEAMKSVKIIQRNCTLTNSQVLKVYAYMQKNKNLILPIVCRNGGPNTYKVDDEFLTVYAHDAKSGKSVRVEMKDLPEVPNPELAKAMDKSGVAELKLAPGEKTTKLSVADIKNITDGKGPR